MKTYIIDPNTGCPVTIEAWQKAPNPKKARMLVVDNGRGGALLLPKVYQPLEMTYQQAKLAVVDLKPEGIIKANRGVAYHLPTRREFLDLFDARAKGLDEALKLIDGDLVAPGHYYWTGERTSNPCRELAGHWLFNFGNGSIVSYGDPESGRHLLIPVANIEINGLI